jgi:hypothetical protein
MNIANAFAELRLRYVELVQPAPSVVLGRIRDFRRPVRLFALDLRASSKTDIT